MSQQKRKAPTEAGGKLKEQKVTQDAALDVIIVWILDNDCNSNVQLATLSNVCHNWRKSSQDAVVREAKAWAKKAAESNANHCSSPFRKLFLTDMARELQVKTKNNIDGNFCLAWFAPTGIQATSVSDDNVTCCYEWRGYRRVMEVLAPFGYADKFVGNILHAVYEQIMGNNELVNEEAPPDMVMSPLSSSQISSHIYTPTFAVRGATLARPDGFCLCLETDFPEYQNVDPSQLQLPYSLWPINAWMNTDPDFHPPLSLPDLAPIQTQISVKRSNVSKHLLPKLILPNSIKNPQASVQFINCDEVEMVRLITTPFQCGPIRAPVTMFIVAIAPTYGCFVSGKNSRYEFGHLHPLNTTDEFGRTHPSAATVCIATEKWREDIIQLESDPSAMRMELLADLDHVNDDDSESSGYDRTLPCHCKFESKDPFAPGGDLDMDVPAEYILRGHAVPGHDWHCYVAVFDGKDSMIRVDGHEEHQMTANNSDKAGKLVGSGILDGLSIGSDHQFDQSACFEGIEEKTISELAIFKGGMELSDIKQMEMYLMKKHGLLSV